MLGKVIPNIFFESSLLSVLNSRGGKMRDPGNEVKLFLLSCSGRIFPLNMFLSPIGYPNYGEETVLQPFQLRFVCQITVKTYLRPLQFKSCSMRDLFVSEVRKEKQTRKIGNQVVSMCFIQLTGVDFPLIVWFCFSFSILLNFKMEADDLGELCVSLCFRPISGRLIVTVTKIRGLPKATADRTGKLLQAPTKALISKSKNRITVKVKLYVEEDNL